MLENGLSQCSWSQGMNISFPCAQVRSAQVAAGLLGQAPAEQGLSSFPLPLFASSTGGPSSIPADL